jgi:hypothetical protein
MPTVVLGWISECAREQAQEIQPFPGIAETLFPIDRKVNGQFPAAWQPADDQAASSDCRRLAH